MTMAESDWDVASVVATFSVVGVAGSIVVAVVVKVMVWVAVLPVTEVAVFV